MQKVSDLRASRLRQTWRDIHNIAALTCMEHGPDAVNTAKIADAAGVSPRTFFNYFATKEDAILGLGRPELSQAHLDGFIADSDSPPLLRVCSLTVSVVATALGPEADQERRLELVEKFPELRARMTNTVLQARDHILEELVLEADELWLGVRGMPADIDEAHALVILAFSVVAFAWRKNPTYLAQSPTEALQKAINTVVAALGRNL